MNSKELLILITTTTFLTILSWWYYKRKTNAKVALYIFLIYLVSSIMSIVYVNQPYAERYLDGGSRWWPICYWMILFLITCIPLFQYDKANIKTIECNYKFLNIVCKVGFFISIIPFFEQLTMAGSTYGGDFADAALDLHDTGGMLDEMSFIGRNLLRLNMAVYDLTFIILLILLLQKRKNKFSIFCCVIILLTRNLTGLITGHRSSFIEVMEKLILIVFIAAPLVDKIRRRRIIKIVGITFASIFGFLVLITLGRQLAYTAQGHDDMTMIAFVSRYMGEHFLLFNEYMPELRNNTNGLYTCWYFFDLLGFNPPELNHDYMYGFLQTYTGIQQNVFYSYIGNFVMDFGWEITFILLTVLSFIFTFLTRVRNGNIKVSTLFAFVFWASILTQGTVSFPYCGSHGNLLLYAFIVYIVLLVTEAIHKNNIITIQN